ncbi:MAG: hypothetical protein EOO16_03140 [Chitinophagaceae bacterium]|nr:MAG: hypothetical protein EOO16_03140 [Chitinophagaceae bacterium]
MELGNLVNLRVGSSPGPCQARQIRETGLGHPVGFAMSDNNDLKRILPPDGNLDFELVGHSARAGRMPVHSFKIRTTLESGERRDITEHVATALDRKLNVNGALIEGGSSYYKPDAIAGSLAVELYEQDRYEHTFKVRTEDGVSDAEKQKHKHTINLREAVMRSETAIVQTLLAEGADPNAPHQYGETLLHLVGRRDYSVGHVDSGETARALLKSGANPNAARLEDDSTPLHKARSATVAYALLEAGADLTIKNSLGETPLHTMVASGFDESVVARAIQLGADINARNDAGCTPLFNVSTPEQAIALLNLGADPTISDKQGRTANQVQREKETIEVIESGIVRRNLEVAAMQSRPQSDLASPDEARARRSRGRSL